MPKLEIKYSDVYEAWLLKLKDLLAYARILSRMDSAAKGNLGDWKSLGNNLHEMRIHYGPGFRLYFTWRNATLIFLLAGGCKSTQERDIALARKLMEEETK